MLLHEVNKKLVDLRYSTFDESELDELKAQRDKVGKESTKTKTADESNQTLEELDAQIKEVADELEENRRAGRAKFKNKEYITYTQNRRAPYHFTWVRYTSTNDYREFNQWINSYDYTPVKPGKDPFYPTGAHVNTANLWQFSDVVWVKRDLKEYLLEKVAEKKRNISGQELIGRVNRQIEQEQMYLAETEMRSLKDMERQIHENGLDVDDSVLSNLGI